MEWAVYFSINSSLRSQRSQVLIFTPLKSVLKSSAKLNINRISWYLLLSSSFFLLMYKHRKEK